MLIQNCAFPKLKRAFPKLKNAIPKLEMSFPKLITQLQTQKQALCGNREPSETQISFSLQGHNACFAQHPAFG